MRSASHKSAVDLHPRLAVEIEFAASGECQCGTRCNRQTVVNNIGSRCKRRVALEDGRSQHCCVASTSAQLHILPDTTLECKDQRVAHKERCLAVVAIEVDIHKHKDAVALAHLNVSNIIAILPVHIHAERRGAATAQSHAAHSQRGAATVVDEERGCRRGCLCENCVKGYCVRRELQTQLRIGRKIGLVATSSDEHR